MKNIAITSTETDNKIAALMYDSIVPILGAKDVPKEILFPDYEECLAAYDINHPTNVKRSFEEALYGCVKKRIPDRKLFDQFLDQAEKIGGKRTFNVDFVEKCGYSTFDVISSNLKIAFNNYVAGLAKILSDRKVFSTPIFCDSESAGELYTQDYSSGNLVEVLTTNTPIIDTKNLEWKHILDIRNDSDFINKVRRFRLMFYKDYAGKDKNFIIDDLSLVLEDYKNKCQSNGLDLMFSSTKQLIQSKSLAVAGLGVIAGVLSKDLSLITGAVTVGVVLEGLGMALHITEQKRKKRYDSIYSPVACLHDIQTRTISLTKTCSRTK